MSATLQTVVWERPRVSRLHGIQGKRGCTVLCLVTQSCLTLQSPGLLPARLLSPWAFFRQKYWSGLPCLLQGIFPTQGSNLSLPYCRWILYHLTHQGSPRILEWVAYPFSRGTFQSRNQPRSLVFQVDSLPAEVPRKPHPGKKGDPA